MSAGLEPLALMERLKAETRQQHTQVEQRFRILDPQIDRDTYIAWLRCMQGVHSRTDQLLHDWAPAALPDWRLRLKSAWIERDLRLLKAPARKLTAMPLPSASPWDDASLWGVFYVMEGSTLGGQVIAKHLMQHLGLSPEKGLRFVSSYGDRLMPMWALFRQALCDAAQRQQLDPQRMVASAQNTFVALDQWLAEHLSHVDA